MLKKKPLGLVLVMSVTLLVGTVQAFAGAADIKARMKARLPVILDLKARGIVGETNQGLLAFRGASQERGDVVAAENKDRMAVYSAIAKQQGANAALVGQRRALQIAQSARAGDWLQDAKGNWYQK
jgi:uncharacterized protein YdbL (DUF1318 family)